MTEEDTIAAVATPSGVGGLAVVRVSGVGAFNVVDACFEPAGASQMKLSAASTHTLHYGRFVHERRLIDEVMVAVMRAPRSFTREHSVEITCHGGSLPSRLVLNALLQAGARMAEPGEFTKRAFLNGRIDLAQAEAVADVIHARTELALQAANDQLAGGLSRRVETAREDLLNALAHIEAHIDFPDEDIAPDAREALISRLEAALRLVDALLRTAGEGRILREGIRAAIVGRPNAGKSSLLNRLLGHDRAIVSAEPGTTRDTIEETANVRGIPVIFVDTAGIRAALNSVEEQGIQRTRAALRNAELVLWVIDQSEPFPPPETDVLNEILPGRGLVTVLNKSDLPGRCQLPERVPGLRIQVSCLTGEGMESLRDAIKELVWSSANSGTDHSCATINSRHQDALKRARMAVERTGSSLGQRGSLELAAMELRIAMGALGEIVGQTTTEDLLGRIFSQFCIGK